MLDRSVDRILALAERAEAAPQRDADLDAHHDLAVRAAAAGVPLISSMGTGNKRTPLGFKVTDLAKTAGCPLARVMRRELRQRGITHLKVVYSEEPAAIPASDAPSLSGEQKTPPASLPFVPGAAGLILAYQVVTDLIDE